MTRLEAQVEMLKGRKIIHRLDNGNEYYYFNGSFFCHDDGFGVVTELSNMPFRSTDYEYKSEVIKKELIAYISNGSVVALNDGVSGDIYVSYEPNNILKNKIIITYEVVV